MWNRIQRLFRALFGWLVGGAEDPELILRQLREDLRNKIPEMNRQAAEVVKGQKMLEMQYERQADAVAKLKPQVEAAVKAGPSRKDAAVALITQLQQAESELAGTQQSLDRARQNSEQTLKMRMAFEQKVRQQMQECIRQIDRAKRAAVEEEMAQLMGNFEVGSETDELSRMTEKIDERLARAQARTQVAQSTVDAQITEVQMDANTQQAELMYEEYQRQLGLAPAEAEQEAPKTMASIPVQAAPAAPPPMPPEEVQRQDTTQDINWAEPNRNSEQQ